MYYIYLIKNLINNKGYIGFTKDPDTRWKFHQSASNLNYALHRAIKKHGKENFTIEILYSNKNRKHTLLQEAEFIVKYQTRKTGYNRHPGGNARVWSPEEKMMLRNRRIGPNNPNWRGKGTQKGHNKGKPKPGQNILMKALPRSAGKIKSRPCKVFGIEYASVSDAISKSGYSHYYITSRLKSGNDLSIHYLPCDLL